MAWDIRTIFRGLIRSWTRSGKEREAVRNKGKAASNTDIIRLRRRFCYTSLFFTLTKLLKSFGVSAEQRKTTCWTMMAIKRMLTL